MSDEKKAPLKKISSSWLGRNSRFAIAATKFAGTVAKDGMKMAASILEGEEVNKKIKSLVSEKAAEELREVLSDLKGLAMKAGQMASYIDYAIPEDFRKILQDLQDNTATMSPELVEEIFLREMGKPPDQVFAEWSPKAFAAASIGQVHKAKLLDGTQVAVKVQYPEIAKAIEVDLGSLKFLDTFAAGVFRHQDKGAVLAEVRDRLNEECDYIQEKQNQELFKNLFKGRSEFEIPDVYTDFTTSRILTTKFYGARRFQDFLKSSTQAERNRAGEIIWDFVFESIFKHHLFNADPHPGNYLFTDDGRVVFLDFGCVKKFSPELISDWKELARATLDGNKKRLREILVDRRIAPNPDKFDFDYHYHMMSELYTPWREDHSFQFTHEFVKKTIADLVVNNPNKFQLNMPKDWVFVNRLQWGLHSVLAMLGAESNWHRRTLPLLHQ